MKVEIPKYKIKKEGDFYEFNYGWFITMLKFMLVNNLSDKHELNRLGIQIWKASNLPIPFIAYMLEIDIKHLRDTIEDKKINWKLSGAIPKNDIMGNLFAKYFPEVCCVRYTLHEITAMKCLWENSDKDYFSMAGLCGKIFIGRQDFPRMAINIKKSKIKMIISKSEGYKAGSCPGSLKISTCIFTKNMPSRIPVIHIGEII